MKPSQSDESTRPLLGRQLKDVEKLDSSWRFAFSDDVSVATGSLWRLIDGGRILVTSADDGHTFGLPAPVDAAERVRSKVVGGRVEAASIAADSGDLSIEFTGGARLQLLQDSCGYESWSLRVAGKLTLCTGGGAIVHLPPGQSP